MRCETASSQHYSWVFLDHTEIVSYSLVLLDAV